MAADPARGQATLLPNGEQTFFDNNGVPLSGGKVYFYVPNTTTFKTTWSNPGQTILNTNPVVLDSAGRAIIYGTGIYRQQVFDANGNLIWDQTTTDTSASNSVYWAGLAAGTPNVITVTDPGFSATDGVIINFTALNTNTGTTTLNPSGYGAIPVEKDTTAGPTALSGNEITATNPISVIYRASDAAFHILNNVIQSASGSVAPRCGATKLKIANDGTTPNSLIDVTAQNVVTSSAAGLVINRGSVLSPVSVSVNISLGNNTSTAGGMDGEAPGTSAWIDLFLIDNGSSSSAVGSLAAGHGQSPILPSGYSYSCYIGAMRVDASGNLYRTLQLGNNMQWTPATGVTNNTFFPQMATNTNTVVSIANYVPPTATRLKFLVYNSGTGTAMVAPNNSVAFDCSSNPGWCWATGTAGQVINAYGEFNLTAQSIYVNLGSTQAVYAVGWTDAVNAE